MAIVLMTVDGSDVEVVGVFAGSDALKRAKAAALEDAHRYETEGDEEWQATEEGFNENFDRAWAERNPDGSLVVDQQWESGAGSYDYRMVTARLEQ